ncbi:MAG: hypothetical protein A4E53_00173 [Pelotomaculum sp. PtaB.Bin104]|nr:MAG: hypothetical protein A4E53_00173 [Pelotomaculum sp. PtaB.Bin104]OPY60718.1 MAG: hypothetical protein A4E56_02521 [Pelotomaculum sp. PtaU1.Bin065]
MTTLVICNMALKYRQHPDKRAAILRLIYYSEGKAGLEALARYLRANSSRPYLKWVKIDCENRNRKRRKKIIYQDISPPLPPGIIISSSNEIVEMFEELSAVGEGVSRTGKQGGRRSASNGQAWDAICGGSK